VNNKIVSKTKSIGMVKFDYAIFLTVQDIKDFVVICRFFC